MTARYATFFALYLTCLLIRSIYESLRKSGRVLPGSKILFALIFSAMCTLWISWFIMCPEDPWPITLPEPLRWAGLGIVILGLSLEVVALIQLKGLEDIGHLVTGGIFAKLRHPMYTGFSLWILGWSTYHSAIVSFFVGLVGIGNIIYWSRLEDQRLNLRFGATYHAYRKQTWF